MYSSHYSTGDIFSPLDGDISLLDHLALFEPEAYRSPSPNGMVPPPTDAFQRPRGASTTSSSKKSVFTYNKLRVGSTSSSNSSLKTDNKRDFDVGVVVEVDVVKRGWRFFGTFACLAILNFICAIDATILSVALSTIATDLKGTTAIQAFWCGTSFLLCSTVFQPTWASFSHIIGRKSVLLFALFLFTVGTIVCSVAHNVTMLLVGRCIQGVAGGGLVGLTYVIISDMVSLRDRGKWMSVISLMWAVGSVIGPVIGGVFAEKTTWRWIFYLNFPFCAIAGIGIPVCLKLHPREGSMWSRLGTFDWFGSFLFVSSTTGFLIPLTWGGVMYSWQSWRTLVPLILGLAGLVAFVLYSVYLSAEPLIRRSLFNSSTAITAYIGSLIHGIVVWSMLYYLPLYFEAAKEYSPISSGIALFPITFTTGPAAVVVGIVIAKSGRYRPSIWIGWFLTTLGMGLLICLKESTSMASWIGLTLISGIGTGMLFSAQGFACQASASNADIPFAGAMYSFFRAFGQTLGVAISGVIFQNAFKSKIEKTVYANYAEEWSREASSMVQVVKGWQESGAQGVMKRQVVGAYVESLRTVWIVMCVLTGLMLVASLLGIKEIGLARELETEQGFRYEKKRAIGDSSSEEQV